MYLKTLAIKNFRALTDIDVEFAPGVNVIVGPNAIGKTTVLEAVRLTKALLSARTQSESHQTLISLGAASPHDPRQLIAQGLLQDIGAPLEIRCGFQISPTELEQISTARQRVVTNLVRSRMNVITPADFVSFTSSPAGIAALASAEKEVNAGVDKIVKANRICRMDLKIDFASGRVESQDPMGASFLHYLDQSLPPDLTKFSYFPADRALPRGEQPVQLGFQDASQQLESHNSQPQNKYNRLKNTIFNTIIANENGREVLANEFKTIFGGVLKGRELVGAGVSQFGQLSIQIKDKESGRIFDIDGLSSGEKGLVLTFLLIGRTVDQDGIVLLDEPELHLNPAVCRELIPYLVEKYVTPKRMQIILCSHSPEILAGAFDDEQSSLYHLVSGTLLTRVRRTDREEITEALRLLGTSESEGLLYKATIFVEGEHDIEVLEAGFGGLLRLYKLKDLGGRHQIEKQIRSLQDAEAKGEKLAARYFVFDKDDAPTSLNSTHNVRILQWGRRCLENYLIDIDVITDLLKDGDVSKAAVRSTGEVSKVLKERALTHLDDAIVRETYSALAYPELGKGQSDLAGKSFANAGEALFERIDRLKSCIGELEHDEWIAAFTAKCKQRKQELLPVWDSEWKELCDGKRLFRELQQAFPLKMSLLNFKKRVILRMANQQTDSWRAIESLLKGLISENSA
ncbi:MAG: AAA family ATPase [Alphaproteobacteria bacterium]|nr:AAA family ATPase [Alphaproteobacteria bacterium]